MVDLAFVVVVVAVEGTLDVEIELEVVDPKYGAQSVVDTYLLRWE